MPPKNTSWQLLRTHILMTYVLCSNRASKTKIQYSILVRLIFWLATDAETRRTIASQGKQKFPLQILNAEVSTYLSDQVLRLSGAHSGGQKLKL